MLTSVRVWDLPTRLFHWALTACLIGLITTGKLGGDAMLWHFQLGYLMLSLLLFRTVWGLVGGQWSRFGSFWFTPAAVWQYATQPAPSEPAAGHNPLGAMSVLTLLAVLLLQVSSGLMSDDDILNAGPLSGYASDNVVNYATNYHKNIGIYLLLGLVTVHVAAIFFYLLKKKQNLIRPMLNGDKFLIGSTSPSRDDSQSRWLALAVFLGIVALVQGLLYLLT